jgi:NADH dehydrogenase FAD-containing subunit
MLDFDRRRWGARIAGPDSTIADVKIVMVGAGLPGVEDAAERVLVKSVRSVGRERRTAPSDLGCSEGVEPP